MNSKLLFIALACLIGGIEGVTAQVVFNPGNYRISAKEALNKDESHSMFGIAFDQGPRYAQHLLTGLGNVHFPITAKNQLTQRFFDQGINLMYCFQFFEAERAFRTALSLEPDCAMAYWGLAMSDSGRGKLFIATAKEKMSGVTDREKQYIEALSIVYSDNSDKDKANIAALEKIVKQYPEDLDAKALLAWKLKNGNTESKLAVDAMLRQVLAKNPLHPGAHHFRIHLWDDANDAKQALDSAEEYAKCSPAVGHAHHMPGHIFSQVGLWTKAAKAMDEATRLERKYVFENHVHPFDTWNYAHNQDYLLSGLCYVGRLNQAQMLAQELLDVPRDPRDSSAKFMGQTSLERALVRGQRWQEYERISKIDPESLPKDLSRSSYIRAMLLMDKGDMNGATLAVLAMSFGKHQSGFSKISYQEAAGRLAVLQGNTEYGLGLLRQAAKSEYDTYEHGDPPGYPHPVYETLARALIFSNRNAEAEKSLLEPLSKQPENGFAIALLMESQLNQGKLAEATQSYRNLSRIWHHADSTLPALVWAKAVWERARIKDQIEPFPVPMNRDLDKFGPERWHPYPAPRVRLLDLNGKQFDLGGQKGKNVILQFYLGGYCAHCIQQLASLSDEKEALSKLDTVVFAICGDSATQISAGIAKDPKISLNLLSDPDHKAAKAFLAHDDFEDKPLHATVFIDKKGRVWWYSAGTEPFTNFSFLKNEIARVNAMQARPDAP